jgi:hypothetical protein
MIFNESSQPFLAFLEKTKQSEIQGNVNLDGKLLLSYLESSEVMRDIFGIKLSECSDYLKNNTIEVFTFLKLLNDFDDILVLHPKARNMIFKGEESFKSKFMSNLDFSNSPFEEVNRVVCFDNEVIFIKTKKHIQENQKKVITDQGLNPVISFEIYGFGNNGYLFGYWYGFVTDNEKTRIIFDKDSTKVDPRFTFNSYALYLAFENAIQKGWLVGDEVLPNSKNFIDYERFTNEMESNLIILTFNKDKIIQKI